MVGRELLGRTISATIDLSRAVRPSTRDGERHYQEGMRFRKRTRAWSDEQRQEWTLRQLRQVVRQAAAETSFYRERFRGAGFDPAADFSYADFGRLPILERGDVADHSAEMLSSRVAADQRRKDGTGGSSGVPLTYWNGPEERGWRLSGMDDFMRRIGVAPGASTAFLWGHHIDQRERTQWRQRVRDAITNHRWYDCFRLSPELLLQYHEQLSRFRPSTLVAYASALDALASVLLEQGKVATYPTQRLVTGAEKLWPAQRERIEATFPVPVHERYGSREMGLIAAQYDPGVSLAMGVDWSNAFVEPENADADSAILVTKLHADAMPMIRYRVGDQGRFPSGSKPGHPTWLLEEVIGRQLDGLHLPDGRWVHGVGIPHMMKDLAVREFQIRQNADYTVDVLVVPNDDWTEAQGRHILRVLGGNLPGLTLRLEKVSEIPRAAANKWRPVITHAVRNDVTGNVTQEEG